MADIFKLPVSSYDQLVKVIRAYGNGKIGVSFSLDELVAASGINKYILSKNNGFLVQVELVTSGTKKSPTDICRKLASAYSMNIEEEIISIWKNILNNNEFISSMLSFVSVKGRISRDNFINHIVFSSNCGNNEAYKTGAGAIIDILKLTDMVNEENGDITLPIGISYSAQESYETAFIPKSVSQEDTNMIYASHENIDSIEPKFFIQQYTCESGKIAKIIIPEDATEDDLLGFRDTLNIILRRKFKIVVD